MSLKKRSAKIIKLANQYADKALMYNSDLKEAAKIITLQQEIIEIQTTTLERIISIGKLEEKETLESLNASMCLEKTKEILEK